MMKTTEKKDVHCVLSRSNFGLAFRDPLHRRWKCWKENGKKKKKAISKHSLYCILSIENAYLAETLLLCVLFCACFHPMSSARYWLHHDPCLFPGVPKSRGWQCCAPGPGVDLKGGTELFSVVLCFMMDVLGTLGTLYLCSLQLSKQGLLNTLVIFKVVE